MVTVYSPAMKPTRRLLTGIMETAIKEGAHSSEDEAAFREIYVFLDRQFSNVKEPQPVSGRLREALVMGDFPYYLGRMLNFAVLDRYQYQAGGWRDYTYAETLPEVSAHMGGRRFRFSEVEQPVKRREKEEAYATYFTESYYDIGVDDYAKQIDFSSDILRADDLGAFNNIAQKLFDSCVRFEDIYVSALYDNALSQAALNGLGVNYGDVGRLTTANLATAWNAFLQRVDGLGYPLAIAPTYLVIPPILRLTANQILESERVAELATSGINPLRGALQIREDPYIATAPPNVPWYLFANPASIPAVSVVRRSDRPGPQLYAKAPDKMPMTTSMGFGAPDWRLGSFISGDIEISVEDTIGSRTDALGTWVGITDAQGIYYSAGTAA